MTETVCVHCGQPTRYSVGDVFQCKGGCVLPVPEIKAKRAAKKKPMTVTAPAPPPDEPEPEPEPEPQPDHSFRWPGKRKR